MAIGGLRKRRPYSDTQTGKELFVFYHRVLYGQYQGVWVQWSWYLYVYDSLMDVRKLFPLLHPPTLNADELHLAILHCAWVLSSPIFPYTLAYLSGILLRLVRGKKNNYFLTITPQDFTFSLLITEVLMVQRLRILKPQKSSDECIWDVRALTPLWGYTQHRKIENVNLHSWQDVSSHDCTVKGAFEL